MNYKGAHKPQSGKRGNEKKKKKQKLGNSFGYMKLLILADQEEVHYNEDKINGEHCKGKFI